MTYVEATARRTDLGWRGRIVTQGGIVFEAPVDRLTRADALADASDERELAQRTGTTCFNPYRYD
ncbi:MAG TPA: hypothetical protein VGW34_10630 [Allosphingosinicella sp.]|nr:hypothetical protein [Allosphingosinicella sp.]